VDEAEEEEGMWHRHLEETEEKAEGERQQDETGEEEERLRNLDEAKEKREEEWQQDETGEEEEEAVWHLDEAGELVCVGSEDIFSWIEAERAELERYGAARTELERYGSEWAELERYGTERAKLERVRY
jgi:hypothetical protein